MSVLNLMSSHYRPAESILVVAQKAFETAGLPIRLDAVRHYDLQAS